MTTATTTASASGGRGERKTAIWWAAPASATATSSANHVSANFLRSNYNNVTLKVHQGAPSGSTFEIITPYTLHRTIVTWFRREVQEVVLCVYRWVDVLWWRKDIPGGKPVAEGVSRCDLYLHLLRRTAGANIHHCLCMTLFTVLLRILGKGFDFLDSVQVSLIYMCVCVRVLVLRVGDVKTAKSPEPRSTLIYWSRSATETASPKWLVRDFLFFYISALM